MRILTAAGPEAFLGWAHHTLGIDNFVEGGTYKGHTAARAAEIFKTVYTIELAPSFHAEAKARYGHKSNITFLQGDTRSVLQQIVPQLDGPTAFWLDAHWSAGKTAGETDQCPILGEIAAINASPHEHLILIDDARLFTAPPPEPHRVDQWPDIWQIRDMLQQGPAPRYVIITRDMIVAAPERHRQAVQQFWHSTPPDQPSLGVLGQAALRSLAPDSAKRLIKRLVT